MYDKTRELTESLAATPDVLTALLRDLTPERARAARGGDEGWSVVEVICHLRDAEERAIERMQQIRDEADPVIAGYDQEAWARERNYAADTLQDALGAFLRFRAAHLAALVALTPPEWERAGRHTEIGTVTIAGHTAHIAFHDVVHLAQLARQLAI